MPIDKEFDFKIKIGNDLIYTRWTEEKDHFANDKEFEPEHRLFINLLIDLEPQARVEDSGMIARPRLLNILGFLSYLTKMPFMTYEFDRNYRFRFSDEDIPENYCENERFVIHGLDRLEHFKRIINYEESNTKGDLYILYSALDQFRKAMYLQEEDNDNMLFSDEYIIAYFKVLEIFVSRSSNRQNELLQDKTLTFVDDINKNVLINSDLKFESLKGKIVKDLVKVLKGELNISNKIKFFLKERSLLSQDISEFVDELVVFRNSVAHGRTSYREVLSYPIPPFFPLNLKKYFQSYLLKSLVGRVIDKFINGDTYKDDYAEMLENAVTSSELVKAYLIDKEYKKYALKDLQLSSIDPYMIAYKLIIGNIKTKDVEDFTKHFIDDILELDEIPDNFFVIILMSSEYLSSDKWKRVLDVLKSNIANRSEIFWYYDYFEFYKDLQSRGIRIRILEEVYLN